MSVLIYDVPKESSMSLSISVINEVGNTNCSGVYVDNNNMEETYRWYCWQIVQGYRFGFKSTQIVEFGGTYHVILLYLLIALLL